MRSNLECWKPSQHLLIDAGKPRKSCVEVARHRTFRILILASSTASKFKKQQYTHSTTNTHKITTPTQDNYNNTHGQTNNNYTQDNLKRTVCELVKYRNAVCCTEL